MPAAPAAVETLLGDLTTIFGSRLESLVMYGPHATDPGRAVEAPIDCLAIVETLTFDDLRAAAALRHRWDKLRLATPLLLTRDEFVGSLDVFPFEYGDIIDHHRPILGDPFAGLQVAPDDRRRACEVQAKSHLLHLREGFIQCGGRADAVAQLITRSAAPLAALMRNVERLGGVGKTEANRLRQGSGGQEASAHDGKTSAHDGKASTHDGNASAHMSEAIRRVITLEASGSFPATDALALYPEYLRSVEQLAHSLDRWNTGNR